MHRLLSIHCLRVFVLVIVAIVLASCESRDSSGYIMDNYLYRLSNSLQLAKPDATAKAPLLSYPARRELQKAIPRININLLEFLRLSECELQRHIGAKNGALGRVMEATQQLIYDAKFLTLAKNCLEKLPKDTALFDTLQIAYQHKQQYLSYSTWNATIASKEFSYMFSLGAEPLSFSEVKQQPLQLITALKQLNQGYQQLLTTESAALFLNDIESRYQIIESSKRLGEIRLSLQIVTHTLQQADQLLRQRIKSRPLCLQQKTNAQFTIVNNVFNKYYIQQVQRYFSGLHQQASNVFVEFDKLLTVMNVTDKNVDAFWQTVYTAENSEWALFNAAVKQHTLYWQALLEQCGKLPKSS